MNIFLFLFFSMNFFQKIMSRRADAIILYKFENKNSNQFCEWVNDWMISSEKLIESHVPPILKSEEKKNNRHTSSMNTMGLYIFFSFVFCFNRGWPLSIEFGDSLHENRQTIINSKKKKNEQRYQFLARYCHKLLESAFEFRQRRMPHSSCGPCKSWS